MTLNSDAKFEEEPTYRCRNDMRNLANFHASTGKSQNLHFEGCLCPNCIKNELKSYRRVLCHDTEQ